MTPRELAEAVAAADRARDGRALARLAHPHVSREYLRRQLDHLRGPPDEELRERAGVMRPLVRWSLRRGAAHVLSRVFEVPSIEAFESLPPEEVLGRAFAARYAALTPLRNALRFLSVVEATPDRAYAVFETSLEGLRSEALQYPGAVRAAALTLCRHDDGWLSFLDGALSIDALRAFSPQDYGPPIPY